MKNPTPERLKKLAQLIALDPNTWHWPTFKTAKTYKHHSDQELARRQEQKCHRNQVVIDQLITRQAE